MLKTNGGLTELGVNANPPCTQTRMMHGKHSEAVSSRVVHVASATLPIHIDGNILIKFKLHFINDSVKFMLVKYTTINLIIYF